jgi:putative endonuclease
MKGNGRIRITAARRWFVYLIECRDGNIYTGIAVDVAARYAAHLKGKGARYTRSHPPKRLLAAIDYPDRSSALSAEYAVKQFSSAEKRAYALLLSLCGATAE